MEQQASEPFEVVAVLRDEGCNFCVYPERTPAILTLRMGARNSYMSMRFCVKHWDEFRGFIEDVEIGQCEECKRDVPIIDDTAYAVYLPSNSRDEPDDVEYRLVCPPCKIQLERQEKSSGLFVYDAFGDDLGDIEA